MQERRRDSAGMAGRILAPLSHPTRLLIVCLLLERERYAGELLQALGSTKGNISQHLRVLEQAGHVASRRDANRVYYRIADPRLGALVRAVQSLYCPGLALAGGASKAGGA
jgi:DNA-binding transcriptional ArsR family regulator